MATTAVYPLLIKGFYSDSSGNNDSVDPGANIQWQNALPEGRGNLIGIDLMTTGTTAVATSGLTYGTASVRIGASTILQGVNLAQFLFNAVPRSYEYLPIVSPSGQTLQLELYPNATTLPGAVVHCFFENKFFTQEIIKARQTNVLKQRITSFQFDAAMASKREESPVFVAPTGQGNIVAIEFFATSADALVPICQSLFSFSVDGTSVVENASCLLAASGCGRPGLIFPIFIRPGATFQLFVDSSRIAAGNPITMGVQVYFDNDYTGKKQYIAEKC